ncbi:hypothetical protein KIH39_25120 [Telmatocola sphagniphila]|uniref:Uncharacterized protein n=1 Tax=Telmatocola sphagniphila TaxID=1123043 RepID=A0A8E6B6A4_9BACT|nr:hypothetical protein [Telmatocola sphagniphila]QVL32079.1 hypothetical protein KIH39_25120 [Telmatocola sphagniphila]
MTTLNSSTGIPLEKRQEIFLSLVKAQDQGLSVSKSRTEAARQFGVLEDDVKAIEREGLDANWPPLS